MVEAATLRARGCQLACIGGCNPLLCPCTYLCTAPQPLCSRLQLLPAARSSSTTRATAACTLRWAQGLAPKGERTCPSYSSRSGMPSCITRGFSACLHSMVHHTVRDAVHCALRAALACIRLRAVRARQSSRPTWPHVAARGYTGLPARPTTTRNPQPHHSLPSTLSATKVAAHQALVQ